jgi:hypothetical protein
MWNVQKYLDENQIEYTLRGENYFVRCLWHEERSGSLAVKRDGKAIYCFGCSEKGSFLTYVQKATPQVSLIEYVEKDYNVQRYTLKDPTSDEEKKRELHEVYSAQIQLYNDDIEVVKQYLTGAFLNGVGSYPICFSSYAQALFFPVYQYDVKLKENILVGIQRRYLLEKDYQELGLPLPSSATVINARPKWQIAKHFTKSHHLYGFTKDALNKVYSGVVIVEGIRDKIAGELLYPEYLWLATFGCHLSKVQANKILSIHRNRPVILGYDPDKAGLEGSKDAVVNLAGKVLLRRGTPVGVEDFGKLTEISETTYFKIDSNIAKFFAKE